MEPLMHLVGPQQIALDLDAHGKTETLRTLATLLSGACRIEVEPIFHALYRREQAGSTGVGNGLAIPHARIAGIVEPVTLFARTKAPIRFGGPDGKPVSEFFVILVPSENATETHLQLLGAVAEMFSDRAFRTALAAATTAPAVAGVFARWANRDDTALEALQGLS